ncbi:MAG: SAM-dependent chlorinase/fluorinase [Candidatus Obscuribacter phosphatis]|uniref:SAM-dependent chlorinase/fluorinase n=1 Tax=Candidatus Obscuribacter phosphatis TaxID=1906157 RepID=A0A8J7P8W5_9BACT|nr:SAM-dependent chlorinase/fluorinase [Candidatus Obscuribacter phosphatis]
MMKTYGPLITFTSDFGTNDGYTGSVKGVIHNIFPQAQIVDICHQIEPWNVASGAWIIASAYKYFPKGTIHIVVVDPQVGSSQKRILVQGESELFIAPDNGILSLVMKEQASWKAYELNKKEYWLPYVSNTFHTRDIFAPVAAHIAAGASPSEVGTEIAVQSLHYLENQEVCTTGGIVSGRVVHVDRFGNLITNIPNDKVKPKSACFLDDLKVGSVNNTYSSVTEGMAVAFPASHGFLEIAIHQGRANEILKAKVGSQVALEAPQKDQ